MPRAEQTRQQPRGTIDYLIDSFLAWMPEPVAEHLINSQNEFLKAIRAIVDEGIEWGDRHLQAAKELKRRKRAEQSREKGKQ